MKPINPYTSLKIALAVLFFATAACGGSISSLPSGEAGATALAATRQAMLAFTPIPASATPLPSAPPPVLTSTSGPPSPSAPSVSNATRISFVSGTTHSLTQGSIPPGQTITYFLRALQGQPMIVRLDTPDQGATLSLFGANGAILLSESQGATSWQGILPATQDYYFRITGSGNTQRFTLNVNIPARIEFASGQDRAILRGQTTDGAAVMYVAYALIGQEMEVKINTEPEAVALTVWGFNDGQSYARSQNDVTEFRITLPDTQDYVIEIAPQGGNVVSYEVEVIIK